MTLVPGITVVIPTHPERLTNGMLVRAVESVAFQALRPDALVVEVDNAGHGAARTRTAGAAKVTTRWTAFLDSDDWFFPEHLSVLVNAAIDDPEADYLYSYFVVHDQWEAAKGDEDPLGLFGRPFDRTAPTQTTSTILVRTELVHQLGFRPQPTTRLIEGTRLRYGEDYDFTVRAAAAGARIVHVPARTWAWRIHPGNSGGLSGTGDARAGLVDRAQLVAGLDVGDHQPEPECGGPLDPELAEQVGIGRLDPGEDR